MLESLLLPAFVAGVVSFFAPCSVGMLPAYISYFLGHGDLAAKPGTARPAEPSPFSGLGLLVVGVGILLAFLGIQDMRAHLEGHARLDASQFLLLALGAGILFFGFWLALPREGLVRGLGFGLLTALGILATFLVLGLGVAFLVGKLSATQIAILVLSIGLLLVLFGVLGLLGHDVAFTIPLRAPRQRTAWGFILFGTAYGIVSLGCNLPIFLIPLGRALYAGGPVPAFLAFLAYASGVILLLLIVSVSVASSRGLTGERLRRMMPVMRIVTNVVLILAGAYIVWYYWAVLRVSR